MLSNKLICKICSNEYDSCPTCQSDRVLFRWRNVACCIEHADIYLALIDFTRSSKTKEDIKKAKERLSKYDLNKILLSAENQQLVDKICNAEIEEKNGSNSISSIKKSTKRKSAKQYERR